MTLNGHGGCAHVAIRQAHAVIEGSDQRERLIGRTSLGYSLSSRVDLALKEVFTTIERHNRAGARINTGQGHTQAGRLVRGQGVHRVNSSFLILLVDGGSDLETTSIKLLVGQLHLGFKLSTHHLQQVTLGTCVNLLGGGLNSLGELHFCTLGGGNEVLLKHQVSYTGPLGLAGLGVHCRVPA